MAVTSEFFPDESQLRIKVTGRFDFTAHQEFRCSYEPVPPNQCVAYVVDMGEAEYLDSSALGMLLLMRDHAGGEDADIRIVNCRPHIKSILCVANFGRLFTVA